MTFDQDRRSFLTTVAALAATGGTAAAQRTTPVTTFDLAWMDAFKGKHKHVYDYHWHTLRPNSLNPPENFMQAYEMVSGLKFPDINIALGFTTGAFPILASDALWAKFRLGERHNVNDPATGKPAVRNVYLESADPAGNATVKRLQALGAVFWMCNMAIGALARDYSKDAGSTPAEVHAEITAGLLPGVKVVPAHTWAVSVVQERGFTYQRI